jgi:hypothetical protein
MNQEYCTYCFASNKQSCEDCKTNNFFECVACRQSYCFDCLHECPVDDAHLYCLVCFVSRNNTNKCPNCERLHCKTCGDQGMCKQCIIYEHIINQN